MWPEHNLSYVELNRVFNLNDDAERSQIEKWNNWMFSLRISLVF
jgi:hypothetical protein